MIKVFLGLFVMLFSMIALPASAVTPDGYTMTALAVDYAMPADAGLLADDAAVAISDTVQSGHMRCRSCINHSSYSIAYAGHAIDAHAPIDPGRCALPRG